VSKQSWDIIATANAGPDAAWFGFRIAHSLSRHSHVRVTLYVDDLESLAQQMPTVDPSLDLQNLGGVRLAHHRSLRIAGPARHCVVIFDSIVPRGLSREGRFGCGPSQFVIGRLGSKVISRAEPDRVDLRLIELRNAPQLRIRPA
jgi:hypothetical protein